MPGSKSTAKPRPKGRRWNHQADVVGLRFRWKKSGRQTLAHIIDTRGSIKGCKLVRQPDNPADVNAIMVMLPDRIAEGKQLGYLTKETAEVLAPKFDSGALAVVNATLLSLDAKDDWNTGRLDILFRDVPRRG